MYLFWRCFRWFFGYAEFEICGVYGERFLTLCMQEEIEIWGIVRICPGVLRVKTYSSSFRRLDSLARKCGVTLEHVRLFGFPRVLKRYRLRPGLFLGITLYVFLLLLLPRFVWSVEIPNADPICRDRILSVLLDEGFGIGTFIPTSDLKELKYRLMLSSDDVAFVSVNLCGCRAVVDVRYADASPEMTETTPCNLVASRDGQIVSVLVKNGVRCIQKGQSVRKGDLLVGGIVDTRLGYYVVHSEAEIRARVTDVSSESVSLIRIVSERTGRVKVRRTWNFFGKKIGGSSDFSPPYAEYETVVSEKHLSFGSGAPVPVTLTEVFYYETISREERLSSEEAEFYARRALDETDRIRLCGVEVESTEETVTANSDGITVTRVRSLIVDICEEKEFYFEDEGS